MSSKSLALIIYTLIFGNLPTYAANTAATQYASPVITKTDALTADDVIKNQLLTVYAVNPVLSKYNIKVVVNAGMVALNGAVNNQFQKDLACQIARNFQGVKAVNNQIVVNEKTKFGENSAAYGQQVIDATITALVKTKLMANPDTASRNIQVSTANNIVELDGVVNSVAEKASAGQAAINVAGVDAVKNNLSVKVISSR